MVLEVVRWSVEVKLHHLRQMMIVSDIKVKM